MPYSLLSKIFLLSYVQQRRSLPLEAWCLKLNSIYNIAARQNVAAVISRSNRLVPTTILQEWKSILFATIAVLRSPMHWLLDQQITISNVRRERSSASLSDDIRGTLVHSSWYSGLYPPLTVTDISTTLQSISFDLIIKQDRYILYNPIDRYCQVV